MEIGLHSTEMLNPDKFPTLVPNSFFSSQVLIVSLVSWLLKIEIACFLLVFSTPSVQF